MPVCFGTCRSRIRHGGAPFSVGTRLLDLSSKKSKSRVLKKDTGQTTIIASCLQAKIFLVRRIYDSTGNGK
ncbi:MAG: hypothetical protein RR692_00585, partial [Raoultibacter sp.]